CFNATSPQVNPSPATVFRDIHANAGTQIFDEVENLGTRSRDDRAELRAILNSGFKHDGSVPGCERQGDRFVVVRYRTYSPKVFAGIRDIGDTTRDRAFTIRMQRKPTDRKVLRFDVRKLTLSLADLRDRLHLWALHRAADVAARYADAESLPLP